jgi:polyvinyl alcohol dehydrogenase (cytochrome)
MIRSSVYAAKIAIALSLVVAFAASFGQSAQAEPAWTTYHRDGQRSGDDPDAVQPVAPVLAWQTVDLGAPIWSQPLVLGERAYVATVGDEVYALDALTGQVVWAKSVGTPVPASGLPCGDVTPTVGVVGTPVIDIDTGTIYVVADRWDATSGQAKHWLVGLSLSSGEEVLQTDVDPPGVDPKALLQRTALNLDAGKVVFGMGGNDGDCGAYRGAVVAVPGIGGPPTPPTFWQYAPKPPSSSGGAVWATGGPAVDGAGNVYVATGNPNPVGGEATMYDFSDSVLKLNPAQDFVADPNTELASPLGSFEPPTWQEESNSDKDLGSAAPELLPGGVLFQAGKTGVGYLIDESTMSSVFSAPVCSENGGFSGSFGSDSFVAGGAGGTIYVACENGTQALSYDQGARTFAPLWQAEQQDAVGPPIVSAGAVWTVATGGFEGGGTTMYGFDPASGQARYFVALPSPVIDHFASPSAAGGRLFVATGSSVTAYRVTQLAAGESAAAPGNGVVAPSSLGPTTTKSFSAPVQVPVPVVLHGTHLHASARGVVRVALRCVLPAGGCSGTVALRAKILSTTGKGRHVVRRTSTVTLARKRFGPIGGSFAVRVGLGKHALALLRRHHGHLGVTVEIFAPGHSTLRVDGVLTLAAR